MSKILVNLRVTRMPTCARCGVTVSPSEDGVLVTIERNVWFFCAMGCAEDYPWPRALDRRRFGRRELAACRLGIVVGAGAAIGVVCALAALW